MGREHYRGKVYRRDPEQVVRWINLDYQLPDDSSMPRRNDE